MDYTIRLLPDQDDGYFTVRWSPLAKADKYEIATRVPAIGGIAEIYYMDEKGKLNLFCLQRSWYGGLRAMLRERCDPSVEKDPFRLSILVKWHDRIYYRWSNSESKADMDDVMFFFVETYAPGSGSVEHSGRFDRIHVNEVDAEKIVSI